jgi:hypothetical protein
MTMMAQYKLAVKLGSYGLIDLYKIAKVEPMISFKSNGELVSKNLINLLETSKADEGKTLIQNESGGKIYPFFQQNHKVEMTKDSVKLTYPDKIGPGNYLIVTGTEDSTYLIDVLGKIINNNLELSFYHRFYPDINGRMFRNYLGNLTLPIKTTTVSSKNGFWVNEGKDISNVSVIDNYRLKINGVVVVLPQLDSGREKLISSVIISGRKIEAAVLEKVSEEVLGPVDFGMAEPQVCTGVQLDGYDSTAKVTSLGLVAESTRGAVCVHNMVMKPKGEYLEYILSARGSIETRQNSSLKMAKAVESKGEAVKKAYVCIKQPGGNGDCLNSHRNIRLFDDFNQYRVSINTSLAGSSPVIIQVGTIPSGKDKQMMVINNRTSLNWYQQKEVKELSFEPVFPRLEVVINDKLTVGWPDTVGLYSFHFHPEY